MSRRQGRAPSAFTVVAGGALLLAMGCLALYDALFHESWRDEAHAVLIAAHAPLHRFFLSMRLEGVPFLFQFLLKISSFGLSPRASLLLGGVLGYGALLFGTYRCLESICRRRVASLAMTALFAVTYPYVYEFGAVIRQYGLGAAFALLTNAYLRDGLRDRALRPVWLGTVAAALCALTSIQAACFAGGSLLAFGLVWLLRERTAWRVLPPLAAVPSFVLAYAVALPFPGRALGEADANSRTARTAHDLLAHAAQAISGCFTPQDYWMSASFGEPAVLDFIALLRHWAPVGIAAGVAYSVTLRLAPAWHNYRPILAYDLIAILVGWRGMLQIILIYYWGFARHHLLLSIPVVVLLVGWGAQRSPGPCRWAAIPALALTAFWFAFQVVLAARVLLIDLERPFSDAKEAAALLAPGAHLLTDSIMVQEAYMLWRPDIQMRGQDNGGRRLGYVALDPAWKMTVPLAPYVRDDCEVASDRTYYSGDPVAVSLYRACLRMVRPRSWGYQFTNERFDLFQIDCRCVAATGGP